MKTPTANSDVIAVGYSLTVSEKDAASLFTRSAARTAVSEALSYQLGPLSAASRKDLIDSAILAISERSSSICRCKSRREDSEGTSYPETSTIAMSFTKMLFVGRCSAAGSFAAATER
jgi:hypothetical protein